MERLRPKSISIPIVHATLWPLSMLGYPHFRGELPYRSMGQPDLYPFVLSREVIGKLGYLDALVHNRLTAVRDRETLTQAGWLAQVTQAVG
jgi:hypothetical protein